MASRSIPRSAASAPTRFEAAARLLVLIVAALFLFALGGAVLVHFAHPFARVLVFIVFAIPLGALMLLIRQGWVALGRF